MTVDELELAARGLPEHERMDLAQRLFESLVGDEPTIGAWFDDAEPESPEDTAEGGPHFPAAA